MNNLLKTAIITLVISVILIVGSVWYSETHKMESWGAIFGASSPGYTAAKWASLIGIMGFLVGVGLLIGGLVQRSKSDQQRQ